jgi:hypothetical protein
MRSASAKRLSFLAAWRASTSERTSSGVVSSFWSECPRHPSSRPARQGPPGWPPLTGLRRRGDVHIPRQSKITPSASAVLRSRPWPRQSGRGPPARAAKASSSGVIARSARTQKKQRVVPRGVERSRDAFACSIRSREKLMGLRYWALSMNMRTASRSYSRRFRAR